MTTSTLKFDPFPEAPAAVLRRYRLDVVATNAVDVIRSAGGWLFDRAMAGWDVNLLLAEPCSVQSLRMLGIRTFPVDATAWPHTHAIAVAAEVFNTDPHVRENVVKAMDRGVTEVALWGDTWLAEFHHRAEAVEHRLSGAARAFKAHAFAAAHLSTASIPGTESFRSGARWYPPYESDLIPIG